MLSAGLGQLSLVEHALCPLDVRRSLLPDSRHVGRYGYTDASGERREARVEVLCPLGLSAVDEFYLWGLLALCLAQEEPSCEFYATPYYCLQQLGVVGRGSRGGKNYRLFRESLRRLAAAQYQNDGFYDPLRKEHRRVSFGFLNYSLPLWDDSSRAWRIVWDPLFFEYCRATGGRLHFDLALYRQLDPASRRLLLLLSKVFYRRAESPWFDLNHLCVQALGFSPSLSCRTLKEKLTRIAVTLCGKAVIAPGDPRGWFHRRSRGVYAVRFERGAYFSRRGSKHKSIESPLREPLATIGLDAESVDRVLRSYPRSLVQTWTDVTLAALEHRGQRSFRRSPAAYLINNLQAAARGERTPPDWFVEVRRQEKHGPVRSRSSGRIQQSREYARGHSRPMRRALPKDLASREAAAAFAKLFQEAGQSGERSEQNAKRVVQQRSPRSTKKTP